MKFCCSICIGTAAWFQWAPLVVSESNVIVGASLVLWVRFPIGPLCLLYWVSFFRGIAQVGTLAFSEELSSQILMVLSDADVRLLGIHGSLCLLIKFKSHHSHSRQKASPITTLSIPC